MGCLFFKKKCREFSKEKPNYGSLSIRKKFSYAKGNIFLQKKNHHPYQSYNYLVVTTCIRPHQGIS